MHHAGFKLSAILSLIRGFLLVCVRAARGRAGLGRARGLDLRRKFVVVVLQPSKGSGCSPTERAGVGAEGPGADSKGQEVS